jgi:23S rRNA (guanosine2251-2'-O)-methyltransferase
MSSPSNEGPALDFSLQFPNKKAYHADMRKLTHAEIGAKRTSLAQIHQADRLPVVAIVDSIRSLYNVGSIFRTSDGVLLEKLVLTGFTPRPPRREIEKTALGSTQSVPWEYIKDPAEAVRRYKDDGYHAFCLELTNDVIPYYAMSPAHYPLCLAIGNEITGVSKEVLAECEGAIEIPQYGIKQSLNVAVAYGVAIFELSRIWRESQKRI